MSRLLMLRCSFAFLSVVLVLVTAVALEPSAHAYVDPGSGLLALQGACTVLAGALYAIRKKVGALLRGDQLSREALRHEPLRQERLNRGPAAAEDIPSQS